MKVERTPFTTYDFIGYFIPGFIFMYMMYLTFDINFAQILSIEKDEHFQYDHVVFTIFAAIFSWFIGHLLSFVSHIFQGSAKEIFEGKKKFKNVLGCDQGTRAIFSEEKKIFDEMIGNLFKYFLSKSNIEHNIIENNSDPIKSQELFLKSISYYMDPELYKTVYNYLVIQGAFRAFTLIFLIHILVMIAGQCTCVHINLECFIKNHFWWIFIFDVICLVLSWSIYLKYYRRCIEENTVLLFHLLFQIEKKNKRDE